MKKREELLEAQRRIQALYPEISKELLSIPGVAKVGIGMKEIQGQLIGETVIRVYVKEKKPLADIPPEQVIPREVRGIKTDVVVVRDVQDEGEDNSKYRPIRGGIQIGPDGSAQKGTLGCFAHLDIDDSIVILSCHHILYYPPAKDHTEIGQPSFSRVCCCTCYSIAANVHGIKRDHLDCAIARLKSDVPHDDRIEEIGYITGVADAVAGEEVKKRGRTTGLTTGTITNITTDATGAKILEIEVKKNNGNDRFSSGGDSGSALLNGHNEIIGLHKQGNNGPTVTPGNFLSTSTGIHEVLDAFSNEGFAITLITGSLTAGNEGVLNERKPAIVVETRSDPLWILEQRLTQTESGKELYQMFEQHSREVLRLLNQERSVTVTWHRKQGPAYSASLMRSAKEPNYRIPTEIEGVSRQHLLMGMAALLEEHGTEQLKRDIQRYALPVISACTQYDTFEEIVQELLAATTAEIADKVLR